MMINNLVLFNAVALGAIISGVYITLHNNRKGDNPLLAVLGALVMIYMVTTAFFSII